MITGAGDVLGDHRGQGIGVRIGERADHPVMFSVDPLELTA